MYQGAHLLVDLLQRAGIRQIFTLSGNQILPIYDACLSANIAVVDTRHEAAAAHMADAWARLRQQPGVCLVSGGPGHTNAVSAMLNALWAESPVLWLSGGTTRRGRGQGGFQDVDQVGIASAVCKAAWHADDTASLPALFALAWQTMLQGRPGPVHLTLPSDLLAEAANEGTIPDDLSLAPIQSGANAALIDETLRLLAAARRPIVLLSPALTRGAGSAALTSFQQTTGIPCWPIESPRGLTDPLLQGIGRLAQHADIVLLFARCDYAVGFGRPPLFSRDARLIVVDPAPPAGDTLTLAGSPASVLQQLAAGASAYDWRLDEWHQEIAEVHETAVARISGDTLDDGGLHPLQVVTTVREALPPETRIIFDGGEFSQWSRWGFAGWPTPTEVNGTLGMLGPAIPFAIAAALAEPDRPPPVAFLGDGTFGFHGMEFDTAVRHGAPFVAIVGNDSGWSSEVHRQVSQYGADRVVAGRLLPTDYSAVVRALGGHGEEVTRLADLTPALRRALASGEPACLNVRIRSLPGPADPV